MSDESVEADFTAGIDENIGHNLKALRERAKLAQWEVATKMSDLGVKGFHQTTIARIESGARALKASEAVALARVFDVSFDEIAESRATSWMRGHNSTLNEKIRAFDVAANELIAARFAAADYLDRDFPYLDAGENDWDRLDQAAADRMMYEILEGKIVDADPVERLQQAYWDVVAHPERYRPRAELATKSRREFILEDINEWMNDGK